MFAIIFMYSSYESNNRVCMYREYVIDIPYSLFVQCICTRAITFLFAATGVMKFKKDGNEITPFIERRGHALGRFECMHS